MNYCYHIQFFLLCFFNCDSCQPPRIRISIQSRQSVLKLQAGTIEPEAQRGKIGTWRKGEV